MALSAPSMAILTSSGAWKEFFIRGACLSWNGHTREVVGSLVVDF